MVWQGICRLDEENLEEDRSKPLDQKKGIDLYYDLVKKAGNKMPEGIFIGNWLWRMYMQKGSLDKYTKLKVIQQKEAQKLIEKEVREVLKGNRP